MKNIHKRDAINRLNELLQKFKLTVYYDKEEGFLYLSYFLWYIDSILEDNKLKELEQVISSHLTEQDSDNIMKTIADKYYGEGIDKGIEQGMQAGLQTGIIQVAENMLKENADLNFIATVTGLSKEELLKIKNSL